MPRSRLAALSICGLPLLTGCSPLFEMTNVKIRTWQLDNDSKVVFRQEMVRNFVYEGRNYDQDELTVQSDKDNTVEARVLVGGGAWFKKPSNFDAYDMIEVRTDENCRAVWVVDKRENRVLWGVVRAIKDSPPPSDFHRPEMTPTSGIALQELTPSAKKT